MQHGIQKKRDEVERLKSKRQEAEEGKGAVEAAPDAGGKRKRNQVEPEPTTKRSAQKKQK